MHPRYRLPKSLLLSAAAAGLFGGGTATAASLTVYVTAHVLYVSDPENVLGGTVTVGQGATGQYTYDTSVPDSNPNDSWDGAYVELPSQASTTITVGSTVFQSDQASPAWQYEIDVHEGNAPGYESDLWVTSYANKPLASGASIAQLRLEFDDNSGTAITSDALPTMAPNLSRFNQAFVDVIGNNPDGSGWGVELAIDSVSTVPPTTGEVLVSPATGSFSSLQNFDIALMIQAGAASVQSVQSTLGGQPGPFSYPGYCSLAPPNSLGEQVILCPNARSQLPPGVSHIAWTIQLTDGTVLTPTVDWQVIQ